jgi:hypothetical protein
VPLPSGREQALPHAANIPITVISHHHTVTAATLTPVPPSAWVSAIAQVPHHNPAGGTPITATQTTEDSVETVSIIHVVANQVQQHRPV